MVGSSLVIPIFLLILRAEYVVVVHPIQNTNKGQGSSLSFPPEKFSNLTKFFSLKLKIFGQDKRYVDYFL